MKTRSGKVWRIESEAMRGGRINLPSGDGIGIVPDVALMKEHGVDVTIMSG